MEIAPGLHRIDTALGTRLLSLYLVTGHAGSLLFDTGVAGAIEDHVLPYMVEYDLDPAAVSWVVISHCDVDHFGGVQDARQVFPMARVVAHEADADAIGDYSVYERDRARGFRRPYGWDEDEQTLDWARSVTREGPVDLRLLGDGRIDLGSRIVDVLHVPGHTKGHLALYDRTTGAAIVSDAVLGRAVPHADGHPAFPPTYRYVEDYLKTIERLRSLAPTWLLTAHYPTFEAAAGIAFLDESATFVAHLAGEVERELAEGPRTLGDLAVRLNTVGVWPEKGTAGALVFPIAGHLEQMVGSGRARQDGERGGAAVFVAAS